MTNAAHIAYALEVLDILERKEQAREASGDPWYDRDWDTTPLFILRDALNAVKDDYGL